MNYVLPQPEAQEKLSDPLADLKNVKSRAEAKDIMNALVSDGILEVDAKGKYRATKKDKLTANAAIKLYKEILDTPEAELKARGEAAATPVEKTAEEVQQKVAEVIAVPQSPAEAIAQAGTPDEAAELTRKLLEGKSSPECYGAMDSLAAHSLVIKNIIDKGQTRYEASQEFGTGKSKAIIGVFLEALKTNREKAKAEKLAKKASAEVKANEQPAVQTKQGEKKSAPAKQPEKISITSNQPANKFPLAITLPNGQTFNSLNAFSSYYEGLLKKAKNDEERQKAEGIKNVYGQRFNERLNQINKRLNDAKSQIKTAVFQARVRDIMAQFADEGLAQKTGDEKQYETPKNLTIAKDLVEAANQRLGQLITVNKIRHYDELRKFSANRPHLIIDGFEYGKPEDKVNFVYRIRQGEDKSTNRPYIEIYDIIPLKGKPVIEAQRYVKKINDAPLFLALAAQKLTARLKEAESTELKSAPLNAQDKKTEKSAPTHEASAAEKKAA